MDPQVTAEAIIILVSNSFSPPIFSILITLASDRMESVIKETSEDRKFKMPIDMQVALDTHSEMMR